MPHLSHDSPVFARVGQRCRASLVHFDYTEKPSFEGLVAGRTSVDRFRGRGSRLSPSESRRGRAFRSARRLM
jgi:hypothetical protein